MKNKMKSGVALLVVALVMGFASAANSEEQKPDGTLRLSGGSFAAGIGFSWGSGTLTYQGKEYPISVNGLSIGKVGVSGMSAVGEVYNLKDLRDFDGHYNAGGAGMTIAGGRTGVAMKNQNGVRAVVASTTRGVDVTLGGGGVEMKLKK